MCFCLARVIVIGTRDYLNSPKTRKYHNENMLNARVKINIYELSISEALYLICYKLQFVRMFSSQSQLYKVGYNLH